jgi:hypothetical protein
MLAPASVILSATAVRALLTAIAAVRISVILRLTASVQR